MLSFASCDPHWHFHKLRMGGIHLLHELSVIVVGSGDNVHGKLNPDPVKVSHFLGAQPI
jgi:hypothetical protein